MGGKERDESRKKGGNEVLLYETTTGGETGKKEGHYSV